MERVTLRSGVLALVILLTVAGMLFGLVSYFLPWYDVYEYYLDDLTRVYPWYVTGASREYFGAWGFGGLRGLYPRSILIGSFIGLAAIGSLAYFSLRSNLPLFRRVTPLIALLLPWISTTSLYILCGYRTEVPIGPAVISEIHFVPVLALGFYTNLFASVLLLLAVGFSFVASHFEEGLGHWSSRGAFAGVPLLVVAAVMVGSAYLPWYVNVPNQYAPEFLLPLTLGISFSAAIVYTMEYEETVVVPLLILAGGLILLSRPQDFDLLFTLYEYGMSQALFVLQATALFWVIVGIVWFSRFVYASKTR